MEATKEHVVIYDVAMFVTMLNVDSTDDVTLHEYKNNHKCPDLLMI